MSETRKEGKYLCADLMAVLGVMLLLGLEYFKSAGFMEMPVTYDSALPIAGRWFCLSGAMLLSACTGYVLSTKRLSWRSLRPLIRLLYIYIISSLGAMMIRRIIFEEALTKEEIWGLIRDFSATDTTRFAGMYVMLLLFAPFLSAAFHDLRTYNARLAFLAVTAGVSTLQPMLIVSGYYIIPPWCKLLAPFAGFIGGAFVRRYAKSLSRVAYLVLLLLLCGLQTAAVVYICTERGILCYPQFDSMASLPSLMTALLTLSLFHSDKRGDTPLHRFFSNASGGAIAALILGDTVVDFVLPSLEEYFPEQEILLLAGLIAVPVIFILCCTVGIFAQIPVFMARTLFSPDEYEEEEDEEDEEEDTETEEETVSDAKPLRRLEPLTEENIKSVSEDLPQPYENTGTVKDTASFLPPPAEYRERTAALPPVSEPEKPEEDTETVSVTLPEPEPVQEENKPVPAEIKKHEPATLNEILEEQGIPVQEDSVDDLIARITRADMTGK